MDIERRGALAIRIIPSVITLAGLTLAVLGLSLLHAGQMGAAVALLAAGQGADMVDGWAARRLGDKAG